jgi:diaminopimelate decarboxylase
VGDHLLIEFAGAYGFVMSSNYCSKAKPAEVLIRDGKAHLVRSRQTVEDLIRGERLPTD